MVELLGTHCEFPECNTLDFLPVFCAHCKKTFCKRHGSAPDHSCLSLLQTTSTFISSSSSTLLPCALSTGCKSQKSPVNFTCPLCLNNFCVEHRHVDDHACIHRSEPPPIHYPSHNQKCQITKSEFQAEKF